ncbi:PCSK5 [Mytilus edulis]|uniref:PCSK5 n=1 Tax=Mytilus edulis TaxID=6550 RepID=A0A8S3S4T5_MYTED|nr:PCSK5 [Mytilus edulis]
MREIVSEGKIFFNNTCLTECPAMHKYLYPKAKISTSYNNDFAEFMCVNNCSLKMAYGILCVDKCPTNAKFEFNGNCLFSCPINHPYIETKGRFVKCVNRCKHLQFNRKCVSICPIYAQFAFNGTCVSSCPNDYQFIEPTIPRRCSKTCKFEELEYNKTCYSHCPTHAKYEFNRSCLASCPDEYPFMQHTNGDMKCVKSCKQLNHKNRCVSVCPPEAKYKYNSSCVNECEDKLPFQYDELKKKKTYGWYLNIKYEQNHRCVASCPRRTFQYNNSKCVLSCPSDMTFEFNGICYDQCPDTHLFNIQEGRHSICVNKCLTPLIFNNTCLKKKCPEERPFEVSGSCAGDCPKENPYKELTTRNTYKCVERCKSLIVNKTCVYVCPQDAKFQYKWTCLKTCDNDVPYAYYNSYINPPMYQCLKTCFSGTFLYNMSECVPDCPQDAKYHYDNSCASKCNSERAYEFFDGSKWHCMKTCPQSTFLFNDTSCLKSCPKETFRFKFKCVYNCPSSHPLNYTKNKEEFGVYECVKHCPKQTFFQFILVFKSVLGVSSLADVSYSLSQLTQTNTIEETEVCSQDVDDYMLPMVQEQVTSSPLDL